VPWISGWGSVAEFRDDVAEFCGSTACQFSGWSGSQSKKSYRAYCAARLKALTKSTSTTVTLVGFWWAVQHSVFPFVFDWRLIVFRFLQFPPLVVVFQLIYLRTRCLPRMIIMH
jgi:hypothetical protein